jgi:hypothetical protein
MTLTRTLSLILSSVIIYQVGDAARTVQVDAIRLDGIGELDGTTFRIQLIESPEGCDPSQLETASGFVREGLVAKGYRVAGPGEKAVMTVSLACGVNGPLEKARVAKATIVSGITADGGGGFVNRDAVDRWNWEEYRQEDPGNVGFVEARKAWDPEFNADPDVKRGDVKLVTVYEKYVYLAGSINLVGNKGTKKTMKIWEILAVKEDGRPDLDPLLPVLAATSGAFVGEKTDGKENVKVKLEGSIAQVVR